MPDEVESGARCEGLGLGAQLSRRHFLFGTGASLIWLTLPSCRGFGGRMPAQLTTYPEHEIGWLSALQTGKPLSFYYPWHHPSAQNVLLKLGQPAGGGVGPDQDVVAFNSFCTHQGGPLAGQFRAELGVAGPCPLHWTTFDLSRHGMVISGHATLGLPQIVLATRGDRIVATGVLGLLYGHQDNRRFVPSRRNA